MTEKKGLRWWPAVVILALAGGFLLAVWLPADSPFTMTKPTVTVITAFFTGLILLAWWLLLSRARWWARLLGLIGVIALFWGAGRFVEIRGFTGNLMPQVALRGEATPLPLPRAVSTPTPAVPAADPEGDAAATETADPTPAEPTDSDEGIETEASAAEGVAAATAAESAPEPGRDFPQFLGPDRNAVLAGVGLDRAWDARPPAELWRVPMGSGWASFGVSGGLAVTQEQRGDRALVVAYDLETGEVRWSHAGGDGFQSTLAGDGPRATPTIHDGRVYAFGADGVLRALSLDTGELLFTRDVLEENGARAPDHGVSSSPLVTDGLVIVVAGGPSGRSLVAYDAVTGEPRWSGGSDGAGYASPLVTTLAGVRQVVVFNLGGLVGHDLQTGEVLWRDEWPSRPEKVAQPVVLGDDYLFASMGYGIGGRLVRVTRSDDGGFQVSVEWETRRLKAKFTQVVEHDGFLYGLDEGVLACLDPADGERRWKRGRYGHGQVLLVDDLLLLQAEDGDLVLIDPNPEELLEIARFPAVRGKTWATPALAGDLLIVRSETEAACFRLPTKANAGA